MVVEKQKKFNTRAAHEYFSKHCFNSAWDLIEKEKRTSKEDEEMVHLSEASLYHWSRRADCTDQNLSVAYWQLSRVNALVGDTMRAVQYGQLCLKHSEMHGVAEVFLGYAYEALARAYAAAGDETKKAENIEKATGITSKLSPEDKEQLMGDINTI